MQRRQGVRPDTSHPAWRVLCTEERRKGRRKNRISNLCGKEECHINPHISVVSYFQPRSTRIKSGLSWVTKTSTDWDVPNGVYFTHFHHFPNVNHQTHHPQLPTQTAETQTACIFILVLQKLWCCKVSICVLASHLMTEAKTSI